MKVLIKIVVLLSIVLSLDSFAAAAGAGDLESASKVNLCIRSSISGASTADKWLEPVSGHPSIVDTAVRAYLQGAERKIDNLKVMYSEKWLPVTLENLGRALSLATKPRSGLPTLFFKYEA